MYQDHREGPGGPPSGATSPGGLHGPSVGGDQPQVRWCAPHKGPRRLGLGEGVLPPNLGGKFPPLPPWPPPLDGIGAAATPREGTLGGGSALPLPLYIVEAKGQPRRTKLIFLLAQPYPSSSSSPAVLGEALLDYHAPPSPPCCCAAAGRILPQPLPLSLLDQGMGDVTGLHVC